jgi:two-component system, NarL family, nitrate/nitrite response regulator NarL
MKPIRVFIVEDHRVVAEALEMLLNASADLTVVASTSSALEAQRTAGSVDFDVALMDFRLPDGTGADAAVALRALRPQASILFLSADESEDSLLAAVEAGASGYLLKSGAGDELVEAVRQAAAGEILIPSHRLAALLLSQRQRMRMLHDVERSEREEERLLGDLTPRELEVLQLIVMGLDNKSIGRKLDIGTGTVRAHVQHLLHKLGAHSKLEVAAWAVQRGLTAQAEDDGPGTLERRGVPVQNAVH